MYVVVLQCPNEYITLSVSESVCAEVPYGNRFETFNYTRTQRTSADNVATRAATQAKPGGLVV